MRPGAVVGDGALASHCLAWLKGPEKLTPVGMEGPAHPWCLSPSNRARSHWCHLSSEEKMCGEIGQGWGRRPGEKLVLIDKLTQLLQ